MKTAVICLAALLAAGALPGAEGVPWNLAAVHAHARPTAECSPVVVAVLDTGIWSEAPGLRAARILPGRDLVNGDDDPRDDNGHGTHIATLIAGTPEEVADGAPLCPECVLLPVKVLDRRGLGNVAALALGIRYAADEGADVINLSVGFDPGYDPGPMLEEAVRHAIDRGALLVASVGNEGRYGPAYPAAYPGVIAVAAVDYDGRRPPYSNISPAVDLAAPGGDDRDRDGNGIPESILAQGVSVREGGPEPWLYSGTSQAAAHVTALAARLRACGVPQASVGPLMEATARDDAVPGFDLGTGAGIVDFEAALAAASGEHRPVSWEQIYRWDARNVRGGVEVVVQDSRGLPVEGAAIFGHCEGGGPVIATALSDAEGRAFLSPPRAMRARMLRVDRIAPGASPFDSTAIGATPGRPYRGVLASPLSRYRR